MRIILYFNIANNCSEKYILYFNITNNCSEKYVCRKKCVATACLALLLNAHLTNNILYNILYNNNIQYNMLYNIQYNMLYHNNISHRGYKKAINFN